jgi:DNA-binding MarR family transcriptional regulator
VPLPLDNQICFTLYATSMAVGRTYKPMLDEMGITYPQYLVLCSLGEKDDMTIGGIADRLGLDSSTVTPLVKRLEEVRLVSRQRSQSDERRVHARMTDAGRSVLSQCNCLGESLVERSGMTLEKIEGLNLQILALRNALAGEIPR